MDRQPVRSTQEIEERLKSIQEELRAHFDVRSLALFGSGARGTLDEASDIDLLVDFAGPARFHTYFDLKFFLEELLGREVDLVTTAMLKPRLRARIEGELRQAVRRLLD